MRYPDGSLIGDLNDNVSATIAAALVSYATSSVDENKTVYDLYPVDLNRPPNILSNFFEASIPNIKSYKVLLETPNTQKGLFYFVESQTIKVVVGASFTLKIVAAQPNTPNIENGIPTIIPPNTGLAYVWRRDAVVIAGQNNSLEIKNIGVNQAGVYSCEVSNDIASITETISVEVISVDDSPSLYKNLVLNPNGFDGVESWNASSDDLIAKSFSDNPFANFTKPNILDTFGYTLDMLRPDPRVPLAKPTKGIQKNTVVENNTYFTRTRYKFMKKGGSYSVSAYQDIDVSDLSEFIKGGIYGISGVRAYFNCYLGNGVTQFIPVSGTMSSVGRSDEANYDMTQPRLSHDNFRKAGPSFGPTEWVTVHLQEYDAETRLKSKLLVGTIVDKTILQDPWISRWWNSNKYTGLHGISTDGHSTADARDRVLKITDEIYPPQGLVPNYGQVAERVGVTIDSLHPNTTKVRIIINFEIRDRRLSDLWVDGMEASSEIFEYYSWQCPMINTGWGDVGNTYDAQIVKKLKDSAVKTSLGGDKPLTQIIPAGGDPHVMATGFSFVLVPLIVNNAPAINNQTATLQNNLKMGNTTSKAPKSDTSSTPDRAAEVEEVDIIEIGGI